MTGSSAFFSSFEWSGPCFLADFDLVFVDLNFLSQCNRSANPSPASSLEHNSMLQHQIVALYTVSVLWLLES